MKVLALYLLLVLVSCKSSSSKEKLLGTWTTDQDESKYPKSGILDKLTFYKNDSFKVEMFMDGKLHESFSGKYKLDEEQKLLYTKVDTMEIQSEIIELTNQRLSTKNNKMKMISNYKRL